jgi:flagellar hook-associated protein 3 FlgL
VASELKSIANFMLGIANSKYEGNFVFSGYKSNQPPFTTVASNYSGDNNEIVIGIDSESFLGINITGDKVFLFNKFPSTSIITEDGKHIYYNAALDGSLDIEIRDTDNITVLKTINVKNVIDGVDKLSEAFKKNNLLEAKALFEIVSFAKNQVIVSQTEVGAKLSRLERQYEKLDESDLIYKKLLSDVQDADIAQVASEIANIQASLEALRLSASKIFSQSLLDFLR